MPRPFKDKEKNWPETVAFRTSTETKAWLRYQATSQRKSIGDIINAIIAEHRSNPDAKEPA